MLKTEMNITWTNFTKNEPCYTSMCCLMQGSFFIWSNFWNWIFYLKIRITTFKL